MRQFEMFFNHGLNIKHFKLKKASKQYQYFCEIELSKRLVCYFSHKYVKVRFKSIFINALFMFCKCAL